MGISGVIKLLWQCVHIPMINARIEVVETKGKQSQRRQNIEICQISMIESGNWICLTSRIICVLYCTLNLETESATLPNKASKLDNLWILVL